MSNCILLPCLLNLCAAYITRNFKLDESQAGIRFLGEISTTSLVAQLVKNLLAVWETWVQSLGWEDLLEKGTATHSSILAWRIRWTIVHGVAKSYMTE